MIPMRLQNNHISKLSNLPAKYTNQRFYIFSNFYCQPISRLPQIAKVYINREDASIGTIAI
jgi:hypothetical protein